MFKHLFTATVLCTSAAVFAQSQPERIGKVAEVEGVVTVSNGVTVRTAVVGALVIEGTRYVTAASGSTRLSMDNGCDIRLKPNESLVVDGRRDCAALIALIQPVGTNVAAVAVGAGGMTTGTASAIIVGGAILASSLNSGSGANNSAPGGGGGVPEVPGGGGGVPVVPISGQ